MNRKLITLTIMVVILRMSCLGQINDFKDILTHPVKNKVFLKKNDSVESERAFLGLIKDSLGKIVFYVVKEFYTVQAALVRHGHNRIVFFNKQKKLIASYYLDLPEDLPYNLANNSLYFKYRTDTIQGTQIQTIKIDGKLPIPICVKPGDCYCPAKPSRLSHPLP
jgi:hypothetical protein